MVSTEPAHGLKLDPGTQLASHRTALALERTLMAADRTQMAVLRTSLSLIGFGFTIYKFFAEVAKDAGREALTHSARNLGLSLVALGVVLLVAGLYNRFHTMRALGRRRQALHDEGLLRTPSTYETSPNMVVSLLLLVGALLVLLGIATRTGPFG
jgi:putative membrane protein